MRKDQMRLVSKGGACKTVVAFEGTEFGDLQCIVMAVNTEYDSLAPAILDLSEGQVKHINEAIYAVAKEQQRVPEPVA